MNYPKFTNNYEEKQTEDVNGDCPSLVLNYCECSRSLVTISDIHVSGGCGGEDWCDYSLPTHKNDNLLLLPTLTPLSGVGTTCISSCSDKDSAIIFTPACRQPSLKLECVLTTANAAGTNDLMCLPKHGGARDSKYWSPIL
jgi:hypothetical protein